MATQYTHEQLFRRIPNACLSLCFASKGIELGFAFTNLKESDVEAILTAFETLSEARRAEIEAQF